MAHLALVVGHHPAAMGARSVGGVTEYTYNTIVANHLQSMIEAAGHRVSRVERPSPAGISALARLVNATGADLCIELHFNAAGAQAHGSEMLHWYASTASRHLALLVQQEVVQAFGLRDRGLKALRAGDRGATLLMKTTMPCILTEPFFGSNQADWGRMKDAHQLLARAYSNGIDAFLAWMGVLPTAPFVSTTAHPTSVQAVIDAWSTSGPNPSFHDQAQQNLQRDWPALANAIRHLASGQ